MIVSGIVALTLSPVMSSLLLQPGQQPGAMATLADRLFGTLSGAYGRVLAYTLAHRWISGGVALLVCLSLPWLYLLPQRELRHPRTRRRC